MWSSKKSKYKKIKQYQDLANTQARSRLMVVLNTDKDDSLRAEAVRALGSIQNEKVIEPLMEALNNESAHARALAAEALGNHANPRAVNALLARLTDSDSIVRMRAAEALGKIGDPRAAERLHKMLEDNEWSSHWSAAVALGRIGDPNSVMHVFNWIERIFTSTTKKLSVAEKLSTIREVMSRYVSKLDTELIRTLMDDLMMTVRITSWEVTNRDTGEYGWVKRQYENPLYNILHQEVQTRGPLQGEESVKEEDDLLSHFKQAAPAGADIKSPTPWSQPAVPPPLPAQPAAASVAATPPPKAPVAPTPPAPEPAKAEEEFELPQVMGVVADFLEFLRKNSLQDVVVVGGAIRDLPLGKQPRSLDVTVRLADIEKLNLDSSDPVYWNRMLVQVLSAIPAELGAAFNVSLQDLVEGNAVFASRGVSVPVRYVGPYSIEEKRTRIRGNEIEQDVLRRVSRLGLVADSGKGRILGLVTDASVNRMWIDASGNWGAGCRPALRDLDRREIVPDQPGLERLGLNEIFRFLYTKHVAGFKLAPATLELIESTVLWLQHNPDQIKNEFSAEMLDRLLAAGEVESIVEDLDLLGLLPLLAGHAEAAAQATIQTAMSAKSAGSPQALREAEALLDKTKREAIELKKSHEEKRAKFFKHVDLMDESRSTRFDIEARLEQQTARLNEIQDTARKAADRLVEATRNFKNFDPDDDSDLDMTSLHAHRDALAFKRERDQQVDQLRKEVEGLKVAVEKKHQHTIEMQETLERLGKELEETTQKYQATQAKAHELEGKLDKIRRSFSITPEQRRAKLVG